MAAAEHGRRPFFSQEAINQRILLQRAREAGDDPAAADHTQGPSPLPTVTSRLRPRPATISHRKRSGPTLLPPASRRRDSARSAPWNQPGSPPDSPPASPAHDPKSPLEARNKSTPEPSDTLPGMPFATLDTEIPAAPASETVIDSDSDIPDDQLSAALALARPATGNSSEEPMLAPASPAGDVPGVF